MPDYTRNEVLGRLNAELDKGKSLLAVGAGKQVSLQNLRKRVEQT